VAVPVAQSHTEVYASANETSGSGHQAGGPPSGDLLILRVYAVLTCPDGDLAALACHS
jgi:hypothetical protein